MFKETPTAIIVTNPSYSYIYFVEIGKLVRIKSDVVICSPYLNFKMSIILGLPCLSL